MLLVSGLFTDWLHLDERSAATHIFLNYAHKAKDCNPFSSICRGCSGRISFEECGKGDPHRSRVSACYKQVDHPCCCGVAGMQERKARAET